MLIEEEVILHWINHFYGYGSWDARFWFVSLDESGGELPEEVADKINFFHRQHPASTSTLCDIREAYRHVSVHFEGPRATLFANRLEYRFGDHAVQNNVWKNLISLSCGYQNVTIPDLLAYQKQHFASPLKKREALIRLYPLPSSNNHAWYYSWLQLPNISFLKSRARYEQHHYHSRMEAILSRIQSHRPEVVLMYGMNQVNSLKKSIQDFFPDVTFAMCKAEPRKIPAHHLAHLDGTVLIITSQIPALRHGRIETGFDWEEFGRRLRKK